MKKALAVLSLPLLLLANPFQTTLEEEISYLQEETFVISASRVKENIKKTASSITVIDEEMIRNMGANNILDVLATVPGIGITQSNIFMKEIEVRGIKDWFSKQVLFMIDGHSLDVLLMNGGSTSVFDSMNLDNIERIEVIKGPASALYGANAFTAMINIITKKAKDINGSVVKIKVASFDTKEFNLLHGDNYGELSVVANLNILNTDGDSVYVNQDLLGNSGDTNPYMKQMKADLKLEYKDFYLTSMFSKREDGQHYGAIGALNDEAEAKSDYLLIELGYKKDISENLNISTRIYFDELKFDNTWELFEDEQKTINRATNEKYGTEALATYKVSSKYTTVLGLMYEKHKQKDVQTIQNYDANFALVGSMVDVSNTSLTFAPDVSRSMYAGYINNLCDITDDIRLTIGARYDDNSDFGSNFAPRGGISWQINEENTLKVMYGEGFRTPTFAEYYNSSVIVTGNSELKPEKVSTYELSLESQTMENLKTKVTLFNNDFTDLIVLSGTIYENIGKTNTRGMELEGKYTLGRGSYFMANYTYQSAKDELNNQELPNIAKHKANLFLNYRVSKDINLFNHLFIKGKTPRAEGDDREDVDAFALLNISAIVKNLYRNLELKASVNNMFDTKTYDPSNDGLTEDDYEREGRNIMLEAKYGF